MPSFDSPTVWEHGKSLSGHEEINDSIHTDEWCYAIDGIVGRESYQTESEAITASERALFSEHRDFVQATLQSAIQTNDIKTLLFLAEGSGYWRGVADMHKRMANLADRITTMLEPYRE
ncbi:hypothetical protein [Pseudomonas sp.]|uniref:hypothetical protein n=1 Tax=Pseudomonas sp. TaxID=306 RepID=UPI0024884022|nr:hypothetical protein [Pseudomonas sp.]MDI1330888.1 hypothetical protein [Pseudomonas sp.]